MSTVTMLKLVLVVQLNFIVQHHVMAQLPAVVQLLPHTEPKHVPHINDLAISSFNDWGRSKTIRLRSSAAAILPSASLK